ncbi:MAG: hypothetical protein L0K44_02555 [Yaniella sp.]|nr:hypothetical protein [Yaniella sp.]
MVTDEPLTLGQLTKATGQTPEILEATLKAIQRDYDGDGSGVQRGFQLRHVAGACGCILDLNMRKRLQPS